MPRLSTKAPLLVACLVGLTAGVLLSNVTRVRSARADDAKPDHAPLVARGKAPIQELLHCPLAFAGVHLLKELPEHSRVAYHFCKAVNGDLNQCVLYDGTGPDAKLIGVYATAGGAESARLRVCGQPGFRDSPDGFEVCRYEVGRDYWTEGFVTVTGHE